jgi:hypothetical protein
MWLAGNLHLNVIASAYSQEVQDALEPFIYELVGTSTRCYVCKNSIINPRNSISQRFRVS